MIKQGENAVGIGKLYGRNSSTDAWSAITDFTDLELLISLQDPNQKEVYLLSYDIDENNNIAIYIPNTITSKITGKFYLEIILKDSVTKQIIVSDSSLEIDIFKSTGGKKYSLI